MNEDCLRARTLLPRWADNELPKAESAWIEIHWRECERCRSRRDSFQRLDRQLLALGEKIEPERRKARRLAPTVAAVLATAAAIMISAPHETPRIKQRTNDGFVAVPYLAPISSYERSSVVSMPISVSELMAQGYTVAADPSLIVQAEVLLGEDGRMHAVRLPSNQILDGAGE